MVSRDEQEYEQRRQQIIDAALKVFSEKGFERATNQDIAQAAGIGSPGLIYHYFENKADLLHQAVLSRAAAFQTLVHGEAIMSMAPRDALRVLGRAILDALTEPENLHLFRVVLSEAMRDEVVASTWAGLGPVPALRLLSRYLQEQIAAGRVRPVNPEVAATCFLGPFVLYLLSRQVFGYVDRETLSHEDMVAAAVDIFMQGMEVV